MIQKYGFTKFETIKEFKNWLDKQPKAGFTGIQVHHMASPSYKQWPEDPLIRQYNIKAFHKSKGWGDIAQHFSTFPDGSIVTGRAYTKLEAIGIKGWNTRKICIENYGNFDKGQDIMTSAQKNTIIAVYALLCLHEGITPSSSTLRYHGWFTAGGSYIGDYSPSRSAKTCPGTNFFGGNTKAAMEKNFLPLIKSYIKNGSISTVPDSPAVSDEEIKDGSIDKDAVVTAETLNVRKGRPDSDGNLAAIVDSITKNTVVRLGYVLNGWGSIYYVKDNVSKSGFVSVKYLKLKEEPAKDTPTISDEEIKNGEYNCSAIVNAGGNLNVRNARPDSNGNLGSIVDTLTDGTKVTLGYVYNNWGSIYYVKDNVSKSGFVSVKYLKLVK